MKALKLAALALTLTLTGCAASLKKQIASDLVTILQAQDCPTVCYALKLYVRQQLGVAVPE